MVANNANVIGAHNLEGGTNPQVNIVTNTQGSADVGYGSGDSGGPNFIGNLIAGVTQAGFGYGSPPDIDPTLANNATFGESMVAGKVSSYAQPGGWIATQIAATSPYHLVLDMSRQVAGLDGVVENLTITAQRTAGGNLEIVVGGSSAAAINGTYYSAPAANISSLTIRGAADHERIQIIGNLWQGDPVLVRPITILGGAGNDTIILGAGGGGSLSGYTGNVVVDGGGAAETNTLEVNDLAAAAGRTYTLDATTTTLGWGAATNLTFTLFQNLTLNASNQGNTINVLATNAATNTNIYPGNGTNPIRVGSTNDATSTLAGIQGALTINSGDGNDTLTLNDQAAPAGQTYVLTSETVTRGGIGNISYYHTSDFGVTNVILQGGGASTYNVQGTIRIGTTTINAGAGNDTINVGSALDATSTIDGILGNLTINGQGVNLGHKLDYPFASDLCASASWQAVLKSGETMLGKRRVADYLHRPLEELYDLSKDPHQVHNVANDGQYAEVLADHRRQLIAWQEQTRDPWRILYEQGLTLGKK